MPFDPKQRAMRRMDSRTWTRSDERTSAGFEWKADLRLRPLRAVDRASLRGISDPFGSFGREGFQCKPQRHQRVRLVAFDRRVETTVHAAMGAGC